MFGRTRTPRQGSAPRDVPNPKSKGYFDDDRPWALPTRDQESEARNYNTRNQYKDHTSHNPIHAAKGFHGVVKKPTYFLAGEAGPERVNITPQKNHSHLQSNNKYDIFQNSSRKKNNLLGF